MISNQSDMTFVGHVHAQMFFYQGRYWAIDQDESTVHPILDFQTPAFNPFGDNKDLSSLGEAFDAETRVRLIGTPEETWLFLVYNTLNEKEQVHGRTSVGLIQTTACELNQITKHLALASTFNRIGANISQEAHDLLMDDLTSCQVNLSILLHQQMDAYKIGKLVPLKSFASH